ncbi:phosphatase PAP2 family protein [Micromonospora sp. NPDC051925]|uniref:phosphatase PAP2 family protein n=1 Tax=Micromonospora sp. NPDC051925 TaxID=3364288 RepID=UPI0037C87FE4
MTEQATIGVTRTPTRIAQAVTEILQPAVWAAVMPVVVAVVAARTVLAGLGWGALAALFTAVVPFGAILYAKHTGRVTDHHISRREQRRGVLLVGIASVAVGLVLFVALGAPRPLIAVIAVMLAVLAGTTAVNQVWKMSAHTGVSAGALTVLVLLVGPAFTVGVLVVSLIGWSRVHLGAHTVAQVVAGAATGAVLAAGVYPAVV